jgi:outer membrane receptor for ferrienterochelin and colicin
LVYAGVYYNNPINKKTRWNCGFNGYYIYKGNESTIYSQDNVVYYPLTSSNNFKQGSQTAYFRIGTTVKKWKFDGGISAQYDEDNVVFKRFTVNSVDTLLNVNKGFLNFLPSATLVYALDSSQEIKFTYSKSVQSPWYSQLCDFIDKTNPFNWSVGNSNLIPAAYNNLYLGYLYTKETWNFNADVFYSITNNSISDLTVPVSDVITIATPENIAHNSSIGIELSSWVSLNKKYDFNFSSSINQTYISSLDQNRNELKESNFGYSFKFNTNIHLSDNTTGTFYVNYFSRVITFQGYNYNYINSSLSVIHKFFNKKLLLTAGVNNILNNLVKRGNYYNYGGIDENTTQFSSNYEPTYFITLQYKFKQGDRETKDADKDAGK